MNFFRPLLCALLMLSHSAFANNLNAMNQYGEPAILELVAPTATVTSAKGKSVLTLHDVDKLVGSSAGLHKTVRTLEAFPVAEFSKAWNSCNVMKDQKKLWNADGFNAVVIFHIGTDSNPKNTHLAKAPLVTAPKDTTRTSGGDEGIAKLMLINAKLTNNALSFDVTNGGIAAGEYKRVRVLAECILVGPSGSRG
jgi:hypothetical protein